MSTMAKMMEVAEAGEFMGLDSMKSKSEHGPEPAQASGDRDTPRDESSAGWADNTGHGASIPPSSSRPPKKFDAANGPRPHSRPAQGPSSSKFNFRSRHLYHPSKDTLDVEGLLKERKVIEATQRFRNRPPKEITQSDHALALKLFYANIQENNISLARELYRWMKKYDAVTSESWVTLIERLAKRQNWNTLSEVYCEYSTQFQIPKYLRTKIVKGLVDSYRLKEAKEFVFTYLEEDVNCSVAAFYLNELRKKVRSEELVETQFRKILVSLSALGMRVADKLFNPLLKTYIQAGYFEKAQRVVDEMKTTYGMEPGSSHLGSLALGMAVKSDWEGVDKIFQDIKALGPSAENRKWFRGAFDRVFLEYFLSHSGQEIRDFVFKAVEEYDLDPDQILFEHIVMAYIQRGDSNMVNELVEAAKERSWNVHLDKIHFLNSIRSQRLNCEKGTMGLWPMFRAAQNKFGRASSSNRVLDFDKSSFPLEDAFKLPHTGEETRWWRKAASVQEPTKRIENYNSLDAQMIHNVHAGKFDAALGLYQNAKYSGKVVKQVHVRLAVVASVLKHGTTEEAKAILEEERNSFLNYEDETTTPLLFKLLLAGDAFVDRSMFRRALFHFYKILEERTLPIKHHALVSLSTKMLQKGEPLYALRLIRRVNDSKYGAEVPFDDAGLKIVARACGTLGNMQGIRWAILTAIKRDQFWDRDSFVELHRVLIALSSRATSLSGEKREKFKQELSYLQYLLESLEKKLKIGQDPKQQYLHGGKTNQSTPLLRLVFDAPDVPSYGSTTGQPGQGNNRTALPRNVSQSTYALLQNWNERDELEKALAPEMLGPEEDDNGEFDHLESATAASS